MYLSHWSKVVVLACNGDLGIITNSQIQKELLIQKTTLREMDMRCGYEKKRVYSIIEYDSILYFLSTTVFTRKKFFCIYKSVLINLKNGFKIIATIFIVNILTKSYSEFRIESDTMHIQ